MTDNEIIKALGYCTSVAYQGVCKDCPYLKFKRTDEGCIDHILKDAFDLINRQKAELEVTRAYLHDNGLEWDLLSYSTRNGG